MMIMKHAAFTDFQETTITEIKQKIMKIPDANGIIIDGFPRDVGQALSFEDQVSFSVFSYFIQMESILRNFSYGIFPHTKLNVISVSQCNFGEYKESLCWSLANVNISVF